MMKMKKILGWLSCCLKQKKHMIEEGGEVFAFSNLSYETELPDKKIRIEDESTDEEIKEDQNDLNEEHISRDEKVSTDEAVCVNDKELENRQSTTREENATGNMHSKKSIFKIFKRKKKWRCHGEADEEMKTEDDKDGSSVKKKKAKNKIKRIVIKKRKKEEDYLETKSDNNVEELEDKKRYSLRNRFLNIFYRKRKGSKNKKSEHIDIKEDIVAAIEKYEKDNTKKMKKWIKKRGIIYNEELKNCFLQDLYRIRELNDKEDDKETAVEDARRRKKRRMNEKEKFKKVKDVHQEKERKTGDQKISEKEPSRKQRFKLFNKKSKGNKSENIKDDSAHDVDDEKT